MWCHVVLLPVVHFQVVSTPLQRCQRNKLCRVYCNWRLKSLWSCSSFKTSWNSPSGELKHLSLTELLLSVFVFIFNKQNQLLVLSVYSLPGSIALQSKQLDRFIVFSIQHPLPCHLYCPALVYCINSYLTYKINTSCHGCLTERRTEKQRGEADDESRERWWKDWLYSCCNPSFLSRQTEMRKRFFLVFFLFLRGQINLTVCGFHCFSCPLSYINVPGDRRPEGNSWCSPICLLWSKPKDGAA